MNKEQLECAVRAMEQYIDSLYDTNFHWNDLLEESVQNEIETAGECLLLFQARLLDYSE